jgi:hypothetical protein
MTPCLDLKMPFQERLRRIFARKLLGICIDFEISLALTIRLGSLDRRRTHRMA